MQSEEFYSNFSCFKCCWTVKLWWCDEMKQRRMIMSGSSKLLMKSSEAVRWCNLVSWNVCHYDLINKSRLSTFFQFPWTLFQERVQRLMFNMLSFSICMANSIFRISLSHIVLTMKKLALRSLKFSFHFMTLESSKVNLKKQTIILFCDKNSKL